MNFTKPILWLLLLLPLLGEAQTGASKKLTLDEAQRLGLQNSQTLKLSNTKLDIARVKNRQLWNAQVPSVNFAATYNRVSDNVIPFSVKFPGATEATVLNPQILNQFTNRLSISQIIYAGGRANNTYKASEFLEKAATLDIDRDKLDVRNNIVAAYYNLYKLQQSEQILTQNLKSLRGRSLDTKNFVAAGTALENDVLKLDLAIAQVETSEQEIRNAHAAAEWSMNILLGLADNTVLELDTADLFTENIALAPLETYVGQTKMRPDVLALDQRRLATEKSVEVVKGAYYPVLSVGGSYDVNRPNQRVFPQQDEFKDTWALGLTLSYNLSALYTNKFQMQEAQLNLAQTDIQRQQLTDGAKIEVGNSYFAYKTAIEKIALSKKSIEQALENQRIVKSRYKGQVATLTELLDADFLLIQSQLNALNAKADAAAAYQKLLKAAGRDK